jgi:hypothetical protein
MHFYLTALHRRVPVLGRFCDSKIFPFVLILLITFLLLFPSSPVKGQIVIRDTISLGDRIYSQPLGNCGMLLKMSEEVSDKTEFTINNTGQSYISEVDISVISVGHDPWAIGGPRVRDSLDIHRGIFVHGITDTIYPIDGKLSTIVEIGDPLTYVANGIPPEEGATDILLGFSYSTWINHYWHDYYHRVRLQIVYDGIIIQFEDDDNEVWPSIPHRQGGNPNNRNIKNITIGVYQDGEPVPNHEVIISGEMRQNSGGHDHDNPPPQNTLGTFKNRHTNAEGRGILTTRTGEDGKTAIEYTSMEYGGILDISVTSTTESWQAEDEIIVRVPGLVELGPSHYYELVGAPDNHSGTNDPCRWPPPPSQHYSNHRGTQTLVNAVKNIAETYYSLYPGTRLRINDMSLEYGGLFDINENWQPPHNTHRSGTNADIGYRGIDEDNNCVDIHRRRLQRIIQSQTGNEPFRESNHFHVYGR